jgi:hypothetical protein
MPWLLPLLQVFPITETLTFLEDADSIPGKAIDARVQPVIEFPWNVPFVTNPTSIP